MAQIQLAAAGTSVAWNVVKAATETFIPFWSGVFLAVGITWWVQNNNNKNTTPKTIGQVLTCIGAALYLAAGIIFIIHFRRMMRGSNIADVPFATGQQAMWGSVLGIPSATPVQSYPGFSRFPRF